MGSGERGSGAGPETPPEVALRLFAAAREAAGTGMLTLRAGTVAEVLDHAAERFGPEFVAVIPTCRVWVNGSEAGAATALRAGDEVAVLPPVSGGA